MTCTCYSFIGDKVLVFHSVFTSSVFPSTHHQVGRWKCVFWSFPGQIWVDLYAATEFRFKEEDLEGPRGVMKRKRPAPWTGALLSSLSLSPLQSHDGQLYKGPLHRCAHQRSVPQRSACVFLVWGASGGPQTCSFSSSLLPRPRCCGHAENSCFASGNDLSITPSQVTFTCGCWYGIP